MDFDLQTWMFGFVRASGFLFILPVFSAANIPVVVRVSLAALLGLLVMPSLPPVEPVAGLFSSAGRLLLEATVGLAMGFAGRLAFGGIELAGQFITTELGLNMSSVMNPLNNQSTQAPGMMLFLLASMLLFALDLHHWLIAGFVKSYAVLPPGGAQLHEALLAGVVKQSARMFSVGIQMAAPIMAVTFVVTLVFAVLGRAVPQMNVFSESFAFKIMAGLLVITATLPVMAEHMANVLRRLPEDVLRVAEWMR